MGGWGIVYTRPDVREKPKIYKIKPMANSKETRSKTSLLFSKLRRPIHYSYIARYILKESEENTLSILKDLKDRGILEESKYANGYFSNSTGPSGPSGSLV